MILYCGIRYDMEGGAMARRGKGSPTAFEDLAYEITNIIDTAGSFHGIVRQPPGTTLFLFHVFDWMARSDNRLSPGMIRMLDCLQRHGGVQYTFRNTLTNGTVVNQSIEPHHPLVRTAHGILRLEAMNTAARTDEPGNAWRITPCLMCGTAIVSSESHPRSFCSGACRVACHRSEMLGAVEGKTKRGMRVMRGMGMALAAQLRGVTVEALKELPSGAVDLSDLLEGRGVIEKLRKFRAFTIQDISEAGLFLGSCGDLEPIAEDLLLENRGNPKKAISLLQTALLDIMRANPVAFAGDLGDSLRADLRAVDPDNPLGNMDVGEVQTRPRAFGHPTGQSNAWWEALDDGSFRFKHRGGAGRPKAANYTQDELYDLANDAAE